MWWGFIKNRGKCVSGALDTELRRIFQHYFSEKVLRQENGL